MFCLAHTTCAIQPVDEAESYDCAWWGKAQSTPHPRPLPVAKPPQAGVPAAPELPGQHPPGYAAPQDVDYAGEGHAIENLWPAAIGLGLLGRQQRPDDRALD